MTRHRQRRNTRLRLSGLRGHKHGILSVFRMVFTLHKNAMPGAGDAPY